MDGMNKGELDLYELLRSRVSETFRLLPNLILDRHKEGTNQIDLVAITQKGVFVFEMKDYSGWIFGNEDHKEWTQMLSKKGFGSKKIKFRNPVKQNENHIKTIRHLLSKHNYHLPIFNVVVFGAGASLKDVTCSIDVTRLDEVLATIDKYPDISCDVQTLAEVEALILGKNKEGADAVEAHLNYVREVSQSGSARDDDHTVVVGDESWRRDGEWGEVSYKGYRARGDANNCGDGGDGWREILWLKILLILALLAVTVNYPVVLLGLLLFVPKRRYYRNNGRAGYGFIALGLILALYFSYNVSTVSQRNEVGVEVVGVISESVAVPMAAPVALTAAPSEGVVVDKLIGLGSDVDHVVKLLGEPDRIDGSQYLYRNSSVTFDGAWKVSGWTSVLNQLSIGLEKPVGGVIDLGSSRESVVRALGSPTGVDEGNPYRWIYNSSHIMFDNEWKVSGWSNVLDQLAIGLEKPTGGLIDVGSTRDAVKKALGSPTSISKGDPFRWNYINSYVKFDSEWLVSSWKNITEQLTHVLP